VDEQQFIDFLSAFGESFCESLGPAVGWDKIVPQDAYEVFLRVLNQDPSPRLLASLSESQLEQLRADCERYFECAGIDIAQVREVIARTLARWPIDFD